MRSDRITGEGIYIQGTISDEKLYWEPRKSDIKNILDAKRLRTTNYEL